MQTISESVHTNLISCPCPQTPPCSDGRRAVSAAPTGFAAVAAWQANVCALWQQEGVWQSALVACAHAPALLPRSTLHECARTLHRPAAESRLGIGPKWNELHHLLPTCSTALLGDNEGMLRVVDVRAPPAGGSLGPGLAVHAKKINTVHFEPAQEQVGAGFYSSGVAC